MTAAAGFVTVEPDSAVEDGSTDSPSRGSAPARFRAVDVLADEKLAEAALHELHTGQHLSASGGAATGGQQQQQQLQGAAQHHSNVLQQSSVLVDDEHMERLRASALGLDEDVHDETTMSCELADLIVKELEQSKGDIAQVAGVLAAVHAAEAAWANALRNSVRILKLPANAPDASARTARASSASASAPPPAALPATSGRASAGTSHDPSPASSAHGITAGNCAQALAALPAALLAARLELCTNLPPLKQLLQQLVSRYQRACRELAAEREATRRAVEAQRQALRQALAQHAAASGALEALLQGRAAGRRVATPAGTVDPWHCEHAVLLALRGLIRLQDKELAFVQTCFSQARDLELQRGDALRQVLATLSEGHASVAQGSLVAALRATGRLAAPHAPRTGQEPSAPHSLLQLQAEALAGAPTRAALLSNTKLEELTRAAATASEAAQGLAFKQTESVQAVKAELFCSPEIVRQGELECWDGVGQWRSGHAVLTRAGSLFLFSLEAVEGAPGELRAELNLARMQFEAGQAPRFHLVQETSLGGAWAVLMPGSGARPRKLSFQAPTVEDCCEWAIAIREAIAVASGRQ